jgi:predicted anti-sigma-YlaC factor YlaD
MNCANEERLIVYFYGEADLRLKAEVESHLGACASCRSRLAALAAAGNWLASAAEEPSALVVDAVLRAARAEAFRARRGFSFGFKEALSAFSLAAAMAVVFAFSGGPVSADLAWKSGLDEGLDNVEYLVYQAESAADGGMAEWEYSYGMLETESRQAAG